MVEWSLWMPSRKSSNSNGPTLAKTTNNIYTCFYHVKFTIKYTLKETTKERKGQKISLP
jgi:hypothetical protein